MERENQDKSIVVCVRELVSPEQTVEDVQEARERGGAQAEGRALMRLGQDEDAHAQHAEARQLERLEIAVRCLAVRALTVSAKREVQSA